MDGPLLAVGSAVDWSDGAGCGAQGSCTDRSESVAVNGVGSNGIQPMPSKNTSTQECASEVVTMKELLESGVLWV